MIKVNGHELGATIFPDGTSQVWNLPAEIVDSTELQVDWRFESEVEIIKLLSLRELCCSQRLHLYIPFLPYARQDKEPANDSTFNLHMFARLLNSMAPDLVETLDVHSGVAKKLIPNLVNIKVNHLWKRVYDDSGATVLVFPDEGARERYYHKGTSLRKAFPENMVTLEKNREQLTGKIVGHKIYFVHGDPEGEKHFFLVDDICDGGATFISAAAALRKEYGDDIKVSLWTTHGIYSKGVKPLIDGGIQNLYTTDSFMRQKSKEEIFDPFTYKIKGVTKV